MPGRRDVVEPQALEAHGRERHELDLGAAGRVDLDDERALGAGLADVVRREAAGVPGGRLRAQLLAQVDVAERPVGVAAVEILGRAGRVALARGRRAVDLRVQHGDRGRARRGRQQLGEVRRPRPRSRGRSATTCPRIAPSSSASSTTTGSCVSASVQPASASGASARPGSWLPLAITTAMPASVTRASCASAWCSAAGPTVAALEDVAGDHERVRPALDGELADAREGLALGGADACPDARVEARARGVQVAIRGVDDPQHGCRRLALRSVVAGFSGRRPGLPERVASSVGCKLGGVSEITAIVQLVSLTSPPCPAGKVVLGGGGKTVYETALHPNPDMAASYPNGNSRTVEFQTPGDAQSSGFPCDPVMDVYVICANGSASSDGERPGQVALRGQARTRACLAPIFAASPTAARAACSADGEARRPRRGSPCASARTPRTTLRTSARTSRPRRRAGASRRGRGTSGHG